ncbi:hypothetical protein [Mucilaginibacter jinjuensis]|uniref:Uncharacterized protein n=1 Tax=Mucilaginibacter jinjuensis TaxID=1176721 RepID=A0ABY7TAK8_9SPHI|nr:hypothetical protein [Mucilaginibacter jinjuensis]WCT13382.1 hypothetical protein PQO05_05470 [Mucilaginibacter jinjuensis]
MKTADTSVISKSVRDKSLGNIRYELISRNALRLAAITALRNRFFPTFDVYG